MSRIASIEIVYTSNLDKLRAEYADFLAHIATHPAVIPASIPNPQPTAPGNAPGTASTFGGLTTIAPPQAVGNAALSNPAGLLPPSPAARQAPSYASMAQQAQDLASRLENSPVPVGQSFGGNVFRQPPTIGGSGASPLSTSAGASQAVADAITGVVRQTWQYRSVDSGISGVFGSRPVIPGPSLAEQSVSAVSRPGRPLTDRQQDENWLNGNLAAIPSARERSEFLGTHIQALRDVQSQYDPGSRPYAMFGREIATNEKRQARIDREDSPPQPGNGPAMLESNVAQPASATAPEPFPLATTAGQAQAGHPNFTMPGKGGQPPLPPATLSIPSAGGDRWPLATSSGGRVGPPQFAEFSSEADENDDVGWSYSDVMRGENRGRAGRGDGEDKTARAMRRSAYVYAVTGTASRALNNSNNYSLLSGRASGLGSVMEAQQAQDSSFDLSSWSGFTSNWRGTAQGIANSLPLGFGELSRATHEAVYHNDAILGDKRQLLSLTNDNSGMLRQNANLTGIDAARADYGRKMLDYKTDRTSLESMQGGPMAKERADILDALNQRPAIYAGELNNAIRQENFDAGFGNQKIQQSTAIAKLRTQRKYITANVQGDIDEGDNAIDMANINFRGSDPLQVANRTARIKAIRDNMIANVTEDTTLSKYGAGTRQISIGTTHGDFNNPAYSDFLSSTKRAAAAGASADEHANLRSYELMPGESAIAAADPRVRTASSVKSAVEKATHLKNLGFKSDFSRVEGDLGDHMMLHGGLFHGTDRKGAIGAVLTPEQHANMIAASINAQRNGPLDDLAPRARGMRHSAADLDLGKGEGMGKATYRGLAGYMFDKREATGSDGLFHVYSGTGMSGVITPEGIQRLKDRNPLIGDGYSPPRHIASHGAPDQNIPSNHWLNRGAYQMSPAAAQHEHDRYRAAAEKRGPKALAQFDQNYMASHPGYVQPTPANVVHLPVQNDKPISSAVGGAGSGILTNDQFQNSLNTAVQQIVSAIQSS